MAVSHSKYSFILFSFLIASNILAAPDNSIDSFAAPGTGDYTLTLPTPPTTPAGEKYFTKDIKYYADPSTLGGGRKVGISKAGIVDPAVIETVSYYFDTGSRISSSAAVSNEASGKNHILFQSTGNTGYHAEIQFDQSTDPNNFNYNGLTPLDLTANGNTGVKVSLAHNTRLIGPPPPLPNIPTARLSVHLYSQNANNVLRCETELTNVDDSIQDPNKAVVFKFSSCIGSIDLTQVTAIKLAIDSREIPTGVFAIAKFSPLTLPAFIESPEDVTDSSLAGLIYPPFVPNCAVLDVVKLEDEYKKQAELAVPLNLGNVQFGSETSCFANPYYDPLTPNPINVYFPGVQINGITGQPFLTAQWYHNEVDQPFERLVNIKADWVAANVSNPAITDKCYICLFKRLQGGCFPRGANITMADNSIKKVEEIAIGDKIWNPILKKGITVKEILEGDEKVGLVKYGFDDQTSLVTQKHPILTSKGIKKATELSLGDEVQDGKGDLHKVTIVQLMPVEEGQKVINFTLEGSSNDHHYLIADGIVVGDLKLQKDLEKEK